MWPIHLSFLIFIVCRIFLSSSTSCDTAFLTRSVQLIFSSTTFQSFPGVCDLHSEVSRLQHHTSPCSKCSTSFFLKFKSDVLMKSILLVECCFCYGSTGLNFKCTYCVICHLPTQRVEIFQILRLFLIFHICSGDGWLEILIALVFFHIYFHSVASFNFSLSFNHALQHLSALASSTGPSAYFTVQVTCTVLNSVRHRKYAFITNNMQLIQLVSALYLST